MYICLVIAILSTLKWVDTLIIENINAKINPYQRNEEDQKRDKLNSIVRTLLLIIASLFWGAVVYFWK